MYAELDLDLDLDLKGRNLVGVMSDNDNDERRSEDTRRQGWHHLDRLARVKQGRPMLRCGCQCGRRSVP